MSLRHYLSILWRRAPLIIIVTILTISAAYLFGRTISPRYQSQTDVLVGRIDQAGYANSYNTAFQVAQSHSLLVKQQPVLEAAAKATQYPGGWQDLFWGGSTLRVAAVLLGEGRRRSTSLRLRKW